MVSVTAPLADLPRGVANAAESIVDQSIDSGVHACARAAKEKTHFISLNAQRSVFTTICEEKGGRDLRSMQCRARLTHGTWVACIGKYKTRQKEGRLRNAR